MKFAASLIALLVFLVSSNSSLTPALAATPTSKSKRAASSVPRWYYWDQAGLKAWNEGNKDKAKYYWDRALNLCEQDLVKYRGKLDRITKTRAEGVINHQMFLVADFKPVTREEAKNMTPQEILIANYKKHIDLTDQKISHMERLYSSQERIFGKGSLMGQHIQRSITRYRIGKMQKKRQYEQAKGWPMHSYDNGGKYSDPRWYEINKDGTIDYVDAPTEDAMRKHDPDFDRNAYWKKHGHVDKRKTGSYYKGRNPAIGGRMPDWYKQQGSKYAKGNQQSTQSKKTTTMYAAGKEVKRDTPKYRFTQTRGQENPDNKQRQNQSRGWGDKPLPKTNDNNRRKQLWGQSQPDPRKVNRTPKKDPRQLWGQNNNRTTRDPKEDKKRNWGNNRWSNKNEWNKKHQNIPDNIPPQFRNQNHPYWKNQPH